MQIRLWTSVIVSGLTVAGVLASFCRLPASVILVPAAPPAPVVAEAEVAPPAIEHSVPLPPLPAPELTPVRAEAIEERTGGRTTIAPAKDSALTGSVILSADAKQAEKLVVVAEPASPALLVNSRRVKLNLNITDVGPSGVSAVELWATRDGKSWQRYSNEPPPNGPLVVCVAEEGRYGFSIVVRNGVGVASPAPRAGDVPQMWVEVDETRPKVEITECRAGHGVDSCRLHLSWKAADVNLAPRPITIYTGSSKDGPWTPVVSNVANTGSHVWDMPRDMPYQFYVRVEAADRAGNVGGVVCHEPVKVDLSRPRGVIIGIDADQKPVTKTATPPAEQGRFFATGLSR